MPIVTSIQSAISDCHENIKDIWQYVSNYFDSTPIKFFHEYRITNINEFVDVDAETYPPTIHWKKKGRAYITTTTMYKNEYMLVQKTILYSKPWKINLIFLAQCLLNHVNKYHLFKSHCPWRDYKIVYLRWIKNSMLKIVLKSIWTRNQNRKATFEVIYYICLKHGLLRFQYRLVEGGEGTDDVLKRIDMVVKEACTKWLMVVSY